jgi:RND family efflux transporter MFP subunit
MRSSLTLALCSATFLSSFLHAQTAPNTALVSGLAIELRPLSDVAVFPQREAIATVVGRNESKIAAEVAGVVTRWTADVGAQVKRGEVLVQLDTTDSQLAIARAQAALDAAVARSNLTQSQLKRARELKEQGFLSPEALLQRETEVTLSQTDIAANKAQLATAQRAVAKATIRAPFAGTVRARTAQLGESVAPGSVLYVLLENRAPELSVAVLPSDLPSLRSAKDITYEAQGISTTAQVLRVSNVVAMPARTQEVRLAVGKDGETLPVGTEGQLRWKEAQSHVPAQYVVQRGRALGVFIEQNGRAKYVIVPTAQEGRAAPITLPAQTKLVTRGFAALQDGQALK